MIDATQTDFSNSDGSLPAVLSINALSHAFDKVRALDALTLSVQPGERVALLGHNGAGKTTLFRLILGFLKPQSGSVLIGAHTPGSTAARKRVAYLPENVLFPKNLTASEILDLYRRLKRASSSQAEAALSSVGLADVASRRVGTFSKGMRQRLGLAQALLGRPALLLLDEPTSGLDPQSRYDFYALTRQVAAQGTAVLQSSHSLTELEAQTDRIAILKRGQLVANGPLPELQAATELHTEIRVRARPGCLQRLSQHLGGRPVGQTHLSVFCTGIDKLQRVHEISALQDWVQDIELIPPGLDEVYRHYSADLVNQPDPVASLTPLPTGLTKVDTKGDPLTTVSKPANEVTS